MPMNKLETAARQALEALESYSKSDYIKKQHPKRRANGEKAITALREALDPELQFVQDWNEGKVRRVFDGKIMGVAEQTEQKPVAYRVWDRMGGISYRRTKPSESEYVEWDSLYAAPVRTKDPCHPLQNLTDDEIYKLADDVDWAAGAYLGFARAVIAADREKNK